MNGMSYKGYSARIEFDAEDRIFTGRLVGITDIAVFHGSTVDALETAFRETVDHYIEVSERTGRPIQKNYSGNLMLRINPDIHAAVATASQVAGKSINQWAAEALEAAAHR